MMMIMMMIVANNDNMINDNITYYRFMYAGAAHADASEYRPCIHLWNYALGHCSHHKSPL